MIGKMAAGFSRAGFVRWRSGRVVVEDVDAPAEGSDHQVAFPPLDFQVANGDRRNSALQRVPVFTSIVGGEDAELGADEQQLGRLVIDRDGVGGPAFGKIAADVGPALAPICASEDIGLEVTVFVIVKTRVDRVGIVPRCLDVRDINLCRLARERKALDLPPVLCRRPR